VKNKIYHHESKSITDRPSSGAFTSGDGLRCRIGSNGEVEINREDLMVMVCEMVNELPKEARPTVKEAKDARAIVSELIHGIGADVEEFKKTSQRYVSDIRGVRMSVALEVNQIIQPLADIRKFFLAHDHKEEIFRLKEFVDLCERLQALKSSGFLDSVADTILKVAEVQS
jgi:hypothetical protein